MNTPQSSKERTIPRSQWEWFGFPGHFIICARDCGFRLCTKVGGYLISTVGDLRYRHKGEDAPRTTLGSGSNSYFETYVFKAGTRCSDHECGCNMPTLAEGCEIDGERCATPGEAQTLHLKYCEKYAKPGACRDE